jgi:hypothetical protein
MLAKVVSVLKHYHLFDSNGYCREKSQKDCWGYAGESLRGKK